MGKSCLLHQDGGDRVGTTKLLPLRHVIRGRHGLYLLQGQAPILAHQRITYPLDNQLPFHQSCTEMHRPIPIRNLQVRHYISRLPHRQLCVSVRLVHDILLIHRHHLLPVENFQLQLVIQFR